jgi:hypothetical protein
MNSKPIQLKMLAILIGAVVSIGVSAPILAQDQGGDKQQTDQEKKDQRQQKQEAAQKEQAAARQQQVQQRQQQAQQRPEQPQQRQQAAQQNAQDVRQSRQAQQTQRQQDQAQRQQDARQQQDSQRQQQAASRQQQAQQREQAASQQQAARQAQQQSQQNERATQQAAQRQQEAQQRAHMVEQQNAQRRQRDTRSQQGQAPKSQPAVQPPVASHANLPPLAPGPQTRLPQEKQQQLITQQQQRITTYRDHVQRQQPIAQQHFGLLQRQHRTSQYGFQQQYWQRVLAQQLAFQNRRYDYNNDPYFYTAPNYRYYRGGRYYEINNYGADLLRQAINNGYEQGYYAGRADRMDHWRFDYRNSFAYQDANYGYDGYYVDVSDYNYYFRQGFQRGYQDGYYGRYRYGRYEGGNYSILAPVLATILILDAIH